MELSLNSEEVELIFQLLVERHRELLREISRTHRHQFKLVLHQREEVLAAVLDRLASMRLQCSTAA